MRGSLRSGTGRLVGLVQRFRIRPWMARPVGRWRSDAWSSVREPATFDKRLLASGFREPRRVVMTNSVCNSDRDSGRLPGPATDRTSVLPCPGATTPLPQAERDRESRRASRRTELPENTRSVPDLTDAASRGGDRPRWNGSRGLMHKPRRSRGRPARKAMTAPISTLTPSHPPELVPGVDVSSIRPLRCGGPGQRWRAVGRVVGYRSLPLAYASIIPFPSIVISAGGWLVEIQFFGM